ncbi:MAG: outer membrane protein assembly factor BamD [Candidatus Neomarinimicrobiota bacterium]|nr:MAG: outer membrane protein assembly factor BamD [Candidatus Neomarinimicrobiota bacterium]
MKRLGWVLTTGIMVLLWTGCAGSKPENEMDFEARFKKGMEYFEKKKYVQAQEEFNYVVLSGSHTEWGDDAMFYLGESYFLNKEYLLAINEYDRLTRRMMFSPFIEQARWRICESYFKLSPEYYLDQENTHKAIDKIQEFLDDYPQSEYTEQANQMMIDLRNKLGRKVYETGILYIKLGAYDSALQAFQEVLKTYYDTEYVSRSYLGMMDAYCHMKQLEEARSVYESHSQELKDAALDQRALSLLDKWERKLNKSRS